MSWTLERAEMVKTLWADGLSASQIAGRIGGVTRNAVIGKVHRMGLVGRATTKRMRSRRQARAITAKGRSSSKPSFGCASPQTFKAGAFTIEPFTPEPDLVIPQAKRKTVATLTPSCCRWPINDPRDADFHFCGGDQVPGKPYCEFHTRRAYQAIQPRNRISVRERQHA